MRTKRRTCLKLGITTPLKLVYRYTIIMLYMSVFTCLFDVYVTYVHMRTKSRFVSDAKDDDPDVNSIRIYVINTPINIYICVYMCIHICMYLYMYIHIYVYVYMYIYTHIYIYIYIYMHTCTYE